VRRERGSRPIVRERHDLTILFAELREHDEAEKSAKA
jgi:hypothetical protein